MEGRRIKSDLSYSLAIPLRLVLFTRDRSRDLLRTSYALPHNAIAPTPEDNDCQLPDEPKEEYRTAASTIQTADNCLSHQQHAAWEADHRRKPEHLCCGRLKTHDLSGQGLEKNHELDFRALTIAAPRKPGATSLSILSERFIMPAPFSIVAYGKSSSTSARPLQDDSSETLRD